MVVLTKSSLFLQREGAEDVLDFWLDVQQHENLCRAYFKDLKKTGKAVQDEWPQYYDYARYGPTALITTSILKFSIDDEGVSMVQSSAFLAHSNGAQ